jgi:hypothetical protein
MQNTTLIGVSAQQEARDHDLISDGSLQGRAEPAASHLHQIMHGMHVQYYNQCCGSMTFWCGSGSADPCLYLWLMDLDPGGPKTCGSGSPTLIIINPYCHSGIHCVPPQNTVYNRRGPKNHSKKRGQVYNTTSPVRYTSHNKYSVQRNRRSP